MVSCLACFSASLFLFTAWFRSDTWRDKGQVLNTTMANLWLISPSFTFDLYQFSASVMFLAAMSSYCALMSFRAAVRSGLDISIWICTWVSCICICNSRISWRKRTKQPRRGSESVVNSYHPFWHGLIPFKSVFFYRFLFKSVLPWCVLKSATE